MGEIHASCRVVRDLEVVLLRAEHDEGVVREKSERGGKERRGIVPTVHDWVDAVHGIDDGPICVPGELWRDY